MNNSRVVKFLPPILLGILFPSHALAGPPKMRDDNGVIKVTTNVHIAFPPSQANIDSIVEKLIRAARTICDATDGKVLVEEFVLERNGFSAKHADMFWLPEDEIGRFNSLGQTHYGGDDWRVRVADQVAFRAVAHELSHSYFGLYDQYNRQRSAVTYGIGPSIDVLTPTDHTIMQDYQTVCSTTNDETVAADPKHDCNFDLECGITVGFGSRSSSSRWRPS